MIQKEMLQFAKKYNVIHIVMWITILQVINLCINIMLAFLIASVLSDLMFAEEWVITWKFVGFIALLLVVKAVCHYLSTYLTHYTSHQLKYAIRRDLFQKVLSLKPAQVTKLEISKISQLSVEGIENIEVYYSRYLPQFVYSILAPVMLFTVLSTVSWKIALVLMVSVFLIPVAIVAGVKIGKKVFRTYWNKYLNVGKRFVEGVQGLHILKMFDGDAEYQRLMDRESEDFRKMTMRVLTMQLQSITIMDLIAYGGTAIGIAISVISYQNENISFLGFICFTLLAVEFFLPMRLLGSYFHVGLNGVSAMEELQHLLNLPMDHEKAKKNADIEGNLMVQQLSYTYPQSSSLIKADLLTFKKGHLTGIAGVSGAGKSTLSHLLQRFIEPDEGAVFLGSVNLQDLSTDEVHQHIGSVASQSHIFEGTILSNLQIAKDTVTKEEANALLAFVRLSEFQGRLDKLVLSEGANLSSGQRQKLAVARMLLKDPEVMIFDEATANMDSQSEREIMEIIVSLRNRGKTVIIITHHLQNLVHADSILLMEKGVITEQGTHQTLLQKGGVYAGLWDEQCSLNTLRDDLGA